MKDLSSDLRALLAAAARADSMPRALRHRERRRLMQVVSAGTITTSAALAEAALLGASKASLAAGAGTYGAGSLTATLVSAIFIGVSSGLVAVSPTSRAPEPLPSQTSMRAQTLPHPLTQLRKQPQGSLLSAAEESTAQAIVRGAPATLLPPASAGGHTRSVSVATAAVGAATVHPIPSKRDVATTDDREVPGLPAIESPAAPGTTSISRETALLAEVQRALKSRRAWMALSTLDRYVEECPEQILAEEATASRIVALCALGRHAEGARWTEQFVQRFPNSPLTSRVLGACPKPETPAGSENSKR